MVSWSTMVTVQTHNGDNGLDKLTPAGGDQSLEHNVYHHDVENVYVDDAGYDTVSCKNLLRSALVTGVTAPVCCCSENMIKILFLHSLLLHWSSDKSVLYLCAVSPCMRGYHDSGASICSRVTQWCTGVSQTGASAALWWSQIFLCHCLSHMQPHPPHLTLLIPTQKSH